MNSQNPYGDYALPFKPTPNVNIQAVMKLVYVWMGLGLLTTTLVAWFSTTNPILADLRGNTGVFVAAIIVELGLVIALSFGLSRRWMTPNLAGGLFFLYAAVNGFTISIILLVYDIGAITNALTTTVLLFGVMSVFGYTTNMDLTKWGTYLLMGLVGLIVAMIVNVFLGSSTLEIIISVVGVLIFTALTAYDTQKIKEFTQTYEIQGNANLALKFSIYGALTLYLDFVNLFLFLLRIFGGGSSRD
jgi:uncharacterized protein